MINTLKITTDSAPLYGNQESQDILMKMDLDILFTEILDKLEGVNHLMELGIMDENCVIFFQSYANELVKRGIVLTDEQQIFLANYLDTWYEFAVLKSPAANSLYVIQEMMVIES